MSARDHTETIDCQHCGTTVERWNRTGRERKYCTDKCQRRAQAKRSKRRATARRQAAERLAPRTTPCRGCSTPIQLTPGSGGRNRKWCEDCHPHPGRLRDPVERAAISDTRKIRGLIRRQREARRLLIRSIDEANPLHKICRVCGEEFAYVVKGLMHRGTPLCSDACRQEEKTKRHQGAYDPAEHIDCRECGAQTNRWTATGTERHYCSKRCKGNALGKAWSKEQTSKRKQQEMRDHLANPTKCEDCSKVMPFERRRASRCEACRRERNNRKAREAHKQRYLADPEYRAKLIAGAHRRRARKLNLPTEAYDVLEVFEAAGWKCQRQGCGRSVTLDTYRSDSNRAVLGHIIAIAAGGSDTRDNVCCLCFPCNMADGTGRVPIQRGLSGFRETG